MGAKSATGRVTRPVVLGFPMREQLFKTDGGLFISFSLSPFPFFYVSVSNHFDRSNHYIFLTLVNFLLTKLKIQPILEFD
jgi:hypothetical protein